MCVQTVVNLKQIFYCLEGYNKYLTLGGNMALKYNCGIFWLYHDTQYISGGYEISLKTLLQVLDLGATSSFLIF